MQKLEKPADLAQTISQFEQFKGIDIKAIDWLVEKSEYRFYDEGEYVFEPDQAIDHMQIIVDGQYNIRITRNNETRTMGTRGTGFVTGVLPFSRMKKSVANGIALRPTYILECHKKHFTEMVNVSYEMVQNLVAVMSNRIREFSHLRYQDEKLISLGKLSAGLAHELNNPASAMVRSADELYKQVHTTPEKFKNVMTMRITPEQTDQINGVMYEKIKNWDGTNSLSMMEREDKMDDIIDWLEDLDIEESDDIAETFVDFDLSVNELEEFLEIVGERSIGTIVRWIESTLNLEKLVGEIKESANRIAELVKSMKSYSHMDAGVDFQMTDIHKGIINTLIMLKHKFKKKNITLDKSFSNELPKIKAFPSQLNQIWTNIIDNAIDAMPKNGVLKINTYNCKDGVCIDIVDNGVGIPEDIVDRIFDPFFTTKPIGEGTGLGLDIVQKIVRHHKGEIKVESQPGETKFHLCFPV